MKRNERKISFEQMNVVAAQNRNKIELYFDANVADCVNELNDSIVQFFGPFEFFIDVDEQLITYNPNTLELIDSILSLAYEQFDYDTGSSAFLIDDFEIHSDDDIDTYVSNLAAIIELLLIIEGKSSL